MPNMFARFLPETTRMRAKFQIELPSELRNSI